MRTFKKIEIIVPEHVAKSWEEKLPVKRAIKKIVDESETKIKITSGVVGEEKGI